MTLEEFNFLSEFLIKRSGLVLTVDKKYLLESRLTPIARTHGKTDVGELVGLMKQGRQVDLERDVVEAMTTNESFFFRDTKPFDIFRDYVLPGLVAKRSDRRQVRIWCAAASSG